MSTLGLNVDAHHHFWRLDRGDYGWLNEADHPKIHRDFMPADFGFQLRRCRMDKTVLVQAAPTEAETRFLLETAAGTMFVAGVVGWADFEAKDAPDRIAALAENPLLKGLRPMLQDLPDDAWILKPEIAPAVVAMKQLGLRFDALVTPRKLPALTTFLERHPDLPVVIDHAAKPDIANGVMEPWASQMRAIAANSAALCKVSGMATEAGPVWNTAKLQPYVDVLLESFGPERLMFGSDWPVLLEAGDYLRWAATANELMAGVSPEGRGKIFGGNAATFYGFA
jgi:L-fuconolactonase